MEKQEDKEHFHILFKTQRNYVKKMMNVLQLNNIKNMKCNFAKNLNHVEAIAIYITNVSMFVSVVTPNTI